LIGTDYIGIHIARLSPATYCACPKPGTGVPTLHVVVLVIKLTATIQLEYC
jgi:hypothetical protein